jgi:hypothetical protein
MFSKQPTALSNMRVLTFTFSWYWKDAKIEGNERFSLTAENQMLVIVRVQASDAGEYACEISSDLGSVRQSAQLTVIGGEPYTC